MGAVIKMGHLPHFLINNDFIIPTRCDTFVLIHRLRPIHLDPVCATVSFDEYISEMAAESSFNFSILSIMLNNCWLSIAPWLAFFIAVFPLFFNELYDIS